MDRNDFLVLGKVFGFVALSYLTMIIMFSF